MQSDDIRESAETLQDLVQILDQSGTRSVVVGIILAGGLTWFRLPGAARRRLREALESFTELMSRLNPDMPSEREADLTIPFSAGPYASAPSSRMQRDMVDVYPLREPYSPVFCSCGSVFLITPSDEGLCQSCGALHELPEWEVIGQE